MQWWTICYKSKENVQLVVLYIWKTKIGVFGKKIVELSRCVWYTGWRMKEGNSFYLSFITRFGQHIINEIEITNH